MNSRDKIFKEHLIQKYLKKFTRDDIPDFETKWKIIKGWRKSCLEGNYNGSVVKTKKLSFYNELTCMFRGRKNPPSGYLSYAAYGRSIAG